MTKTRFGRIQRGAALLPLALLSTAWTASLLGVGVAGTAVANASDRSTLPDGTSVPSQAIEDPASFSAPGSIGLGVPQGSTERIVQAASTNGIPSAALAAYQRAATVINAADATCNAPWQLLAAIGRVESDHGRYGNNSLGEDGVSRPGIYGIALDGTNSTQKITDTDGGQYDRDAKFDRAVGPMQFIPSTWSVVGVDADGDGIRNPQDIDDAALAAAVYLCSGNDDLSTDSGQRASVYRYNHSNEYVDLVINIMKAYQSGDFSSVPNNTTSALYIPPAYNFTSPTNGAMIGAPEKVEPPKSSSSSTSGSQGNSTGSKNPAAPGKSGGGDNASGSNGNSPLKPVTDAGEKAKEALKPLTDPVNEVIDKVVPPQLLSLLEALNLCNAQLAKLDVFGLLKTLRLNDIAADSCANQVEGETADKAAGLIPGLLNGIIKGLLR